jgi:adenine-specific DNA-methyltransferase
MMNKSENPAFLQEQIVTYIGNKRALLPHIDAEVQRIREKLGGKKLVCADLFAGSGVVSRMLKQHASVLTVNDLEAYSRILAECYLCNREDYPAEQVEEALARLEAALEQPVEGLVAAHYAPKNDGDIRPGERAFYTRDNALRIDTYRAAIEKEDSAVQPFLLGPLLYAASVHTNTGGVFKGFYKDSKTGIGKFGGNGENALSRILGKIVLQSPVLSEFACETVIYQQNVNALAGTLPVQDLVYLDPPYNQHPYGSNYFMLNVIAENCLSGALSRVSGIPEGWNRSDYNKGARALNAMERLVRDLPARYLLISYNSEGFITLEEMEALLGKYGKVERREISYPTYRASRNLRQRNIKVSEYLFVLEKTQ